MKASEDNEGVIPGAMKQPNTIILKCGLSRKLLINASAIILFIGISNHYLLEENRPFAHVRYLPDMCDAWMIDVEGKHTACITCFIIVVLHLNSHVIS